jgi:hypothetical protein
MAMIVDETRLHTAEGHTLVSQAAASNYLSQQVRTTLTQYERGHTLQLVEQEKLLPVNASTWHRTV